MRASTGKCNITVQLHPTYWAEGFGTPTHSSSQGPKAEGDKSRKAQDSNNIM